MTTGTEENFELWMLNDECMRMQTLSIHNSKFNIHNFFLSPSVFPLRPLRDISPCLFPGAMTSAHKKFLSPSDIYASKRAYVIIIDMPDFIRIIEKKILMAA